MNSKRVLLSDRHFHDLRLSEQEIGLILDGLSLLAFQADKNQYQRLAKAVDRKVRRILNQPVSHSTVPEAEEREWRKALNEIQSDAYYV